MGTREKRIGSGNRGRRERVRALAEGAVMLALAWVTDFLCSLGPWNRALFPAGGSITVGMLPLVYYSFRRGAAWGSAAALAFSGLQLLMGWYAPPAGTWQASLLCALLDYVAAYTVVGTASLFARLCSFRGRRLLGYGLGALIVCALRYASSVLSGGILWGSYAPEGLNPWIYSAVYNAGYMLPNAVLTAAAAVATCRLFDPRTLRPMRPARRGGAGASA